MGEKEMTPFVFHPKVVIRSPRIPANDGLSFDNIEQLLYDDLFMESIYLASAILHETAVRYRNGFITEEKRITKIKQSIWKYYLRSLSRCTPFGLFSGCAVGVWGEAPALKLKAAVLRHTRLDMHYLCALALELAKRSDVKEHLVYHTNNSLYRVGDALRYVEYNYKGSQRCYQISAIAASAYIDQIVREGQQGITLAQIRQMISVPGVTRVEIDHFIEEILEAQLLVSELEPAVTGEAFIKQILRTIQRIIGIKKNKDLLAIAQLLGDVSQKLSEIDKGNPGNLCRYKEILFDLDKLKVPYDESRLFQTDLFKEVSTGTIPPSVPDDLRKGISVMNRFASALYRQHPNLESFAERFYKRYEDREMPLLEVIDRESGIGYLGFNDLKTAAADQTAALKDYKWGKVEAFLQQKLISYWKNGDKVISLHDHELQFMENDWTNLPPSMHLMFRLLENDQIFLENCGGASAISILSRFANSEVKIKEICADIVLSEENLNKEVVFAEIVHLPESRTGNILLRPAFRKHEIPYLAQSSLPVSSRIAVQDLLVSVKNNRIILRHKITGKRIIPRLSTAHNYAKAVLPVYQFLGELQASELKTGIGFSWGSLAQQHQLLPRVEYRNMILYPATWKLTKQDFSGIFRYPENENLIVGFLKKYHIPSRVVLADGDHELQIDFKDRNSVLLFLETIKQRDNIVLKEAFAAADTIQDEASRPYHHQIIACLMNTQQVYSGARENAHRSQSGISAKRSFFIGSEWLYYKIYCGTGSADRILKDAIKPLTDWLLKEGLVSSFFFVRYKDPDFHIRFRLRLSETRYLAEVLSIINQYLVHLTTSGYIWNIQLDTYHRELERYGSNDIEIAEQIFFLDSNSVLELLSADAGNEEEQYRWLWAMRAIDDFFNAFGFTAASKLEFAHTLNASFAKESGDVNQLKAQLRLRYRTNKKQIEEVMSGTAPSEGQKVFLNILHKKQQQIQPIANKLKNLEESALLEVPLNRLIACHIHMLINRMMRSRHRQQETAIYDFLCLYYKGLAGKQKEKNTVNK